MAIALEFINFIVPISVIREKYHGGWDTCLKDHERFISGRVWFDEHLLRDGAMDPGGIESLIRKWTELGIEPMIELNGQLSWKDCCVTESVSGGLTLPCDWLAIGEGRRSAYLKGTAPGALVGRIS